MEDSGRNIIPTITRAKLARHLSYPIGAEHISAALASSAQLPEIKLHFFVQHFDRGLHKSHYEFLRVEYLKDARPAEKWPISGLYWRPTQSQWEVVVQPVPRVLRHRIKQYIVDSALPLIAIWLGERAGLARQGSDILAFFFDNKNGEEFIIRHLTNLEPLRKRRG